jgi:hypothetical protein
MSNKQSVASVNGLEGPPYYAGPEEFGVDEDRGPGWADSEADEVVTVQVEEGLGGTWLGRFQAYRVESEVVWLFLQTPFCSLADEQSGKTETRGDFEAVFRLYLAPRLSDTSLSLSRSAFTSAETSRECVLTRLGTSPGG